MAGERRTTRRELKNTAYEIFVGFLSVLSIANLVLVYALAGDGALQVVLSAMNALLSVIFLIDFVYRITTSAAPWRYFLLGFGWADLLASLPFPQLKILRIFRLLRVWDLLRALGLRTIVSTLVRDRANSTLMTLLLLGILVLQFGSISILAVEDGANGANITSASDALWYTIVTISTVGYGDQYPVTNAGRILGVLIIIVGVGIFGTFTGYLANLFLGPSKDRAPAPGSPATASEDSSTTQAASAGVASDPIATGMSTAGAPGVATDDGEGSARAERLRTLLAQTESMQAEIRELLAESGADGR